MEGLLLSGWDPAWKSDPRVVLAPIVHRLPGQAALAAAGLVLLALLLLRGAADSRGGLILLGATALSLLAGAPVTIPRVPSSLYDAPSPLVERAAALSGRVFERAWKDFDAVRRGPQGRIESDGLVDLASAQVRQGWALAGAPWGLAYAWDPDPDGSYTILTRYASDVLRQRTLGEAPEVAAGGGRNVGHRVGRPGGHSGPLARSRRGVRRRPRDALEAHGALARA